jgi:hypothetical protein
MRNVTAITSPRIVHWTLGFGNDRVTCGVESDGRTYWLSLVPNGRDEAALVETFASSAAALRRHAELAARLREHGWTVLAYTGQQPAARAGYQPAA